MNGFSWTLEPAGWYEVTSGYFLTVLPAQELVAARI